MTTKRIILKIETLLDSPQPPQSKLVLELLGQLAHNVDAIEQNVPSKASVEAILRDTAQR